MKNIIKVALASVVAVSLVGCGGNSTRPDSYVMKETRQLSSVKYATVVSVKPVMIEGREAGVVGTVGGAIVGALIGNSIGGGNGKKIATTLGVIAGGVAGASAEKEMTAANGQELTLKMADGKEYIIVQEIDGTQLSPGEKVKVVNTSQGYRAMR